MTRIGLEAGPLSQWLYAGMRKAGLAVELLETRHVRNAFKTMPVKTDRKDARGIAELMRLGWFRPVHCKSLPAQEVRAMLTARKLLQTKNHDVEMSLRGVLRGFGLKVGPTTPANLCQPRSANWSPAMQRCRRWPRRCWRRATRCSASGKSSRNACDPWPATTTRVAAADDRARRRHDRRAHLCRGNRRSRPLQVLEER